MQYQEAKRKGMNKFSAPSAKSPQDISEENDTIWLIPRLHVKLYIRYNTKS